MLITHPLHQHRTSLRISLSSCRGKLRIMKALDTEGRLSPDEWEVAGLYRVFAFRRRTVDEEAAAARSAKPASIPGVPGRPAAPAVAAGVDWASALPDMTPHLRQERKAAPGAFVYRTFLSPGDIVDLIGQGAAAGDASEGEGHHD
jgi:hypothetical protein